MQSVGTSARAVKLRGVTLPTLAHRSRSRSTHVGATRVVASARKGSIAIFGATGGTGVIQLACFQRESKSLAASCAECVYQALAKGFSVTTLVRDPAKLITPPGSGGLAAGTPMKHPDLKVTQGNVTKKSDVLDTIGDDCVGVVVALGGRPNDVGDTMLRDGTKNIVEAMKAKGVQRVSIVTSIGAGDSADQAPFAFKVLMFTVMRSIFSDKNEQERIFLETTGLGNDLEWTIVRPGGLGLGSPTGEVRIIKGEAGSIPRADVATFCLASLLDDDFPYRMSAPAISSTGGSTVDGELWKPAAGAARR